MRVLGSGLVLGGLAALALGSGQAKASEAGTSFYLLGSGGPAAAVMPPVKGLFLDNEVYYYDGSARGSKQFVVGGNLVAGLDATILADFPTVLWVPSTDFLGGTLAVGGAVPFGQPDVNVSAVITGPLGGQIGVSRSDDAFIVGDPILTAALGWKSDKTHIQASTMVNIPIGDYRDGELANLAFHRWAADVSLAATWRDEEAGWDLSGKTGFTFNGENEDTDYDTGTEFHVEGSIEKIITPKFSAGVLAYHFQQVSGDSGEGAVLGPFKGRVSGVGGTAAYNFTLAKRPATLRFRAIHEFDAKNRLEGDSFWLGLSVPLHMVLPAGAGGGAP